MFTKKIKVILSFVGFGVILSFAYQNCNPNLTRMSSTATAPVPSSQNDTDSLDAENGEDGSCAPLVMSWQNAGTSCSSLTPNMLNGMEQLLIDNQAPSLGTATVQCQDGSLEISTEFASTCQMQTTNNATNGACGTLHNTTRASLTQPTLPELCSAGMPSAIIGTGPWSWTCAGTGTGSVSANCQASLQGATPTNGVCGSSHNQTLSSQPTNGLCSAGVASSVTGSGPWNWTCSGISNGTNATCVAQKQTSGGTTSQDPRCGAASTGSRGYTSLSQFTPNDYCFTGESSPVNVVGTGPWAWYCRNSDGRTSPQCTAMKATTRSCSGNGTGIKTGTESCTQAYGQTTLNCGTCIPTVCDTGYQITGSPARCEPLNTGSCNIPAGIMKIRAASTLEYLSCEKTMTSQTVSPGSSIAVSCTNGGFSASTALKCVQESITRSTDNGGVAFNYRSLYYRHGRINTNDSDMSNWSYASLGLRSGYIFDENIQREINYNFACKSSTDYSTSSWNSGSGTGFRIQGTGMSPTSPGSRLVRCLTGEDDRLYVVTIECDGQPSNGPEGFWDIVDADIATPVSGQPQCSGGGKTAGYGSWTRD